jgi:hypothetical protein
MAKDWMPGYSTTEGDISGMPKSLGKVEWNEPIACKAPDVKTLQSHQMMKRRSYGFAAPSTFGVGKVLRRRAALLSGCVFADARLL